MGQQGKQVFVMIGVIVGGLILGAGVMGVLFQDSTKTERTHQDYVSEQHRPQSVSSSTHPSAVLSPLASASSSPSVSTATASPSASESTSTSETTGPTTTTTASTSAPEPSTEEPAPATSKPAPAPQEQRADDCPNGDYSGSRYDGSCGTKPVPKPDDCPNGDYTASRYDGSCGTKPKPPASAWVTSCEPSSSGTTLRWASQADPGVSYVVVAKVGSYSRPFDVTGSAGGRFFIGASGACSVEIK